MWKGVLLEIHLLGDLIVGYWNTFIRDVILFPQRRLFIKKESGKKIFYEETPAAGLPPARPKIYDFAVIVADFRI